MYARNLMQVIKKNPNQSFFFPSCKIAPGGRIVTSKAPADQCCAQLAFAPIVLQSGRLDPGQGPTPIRGLSPTTPATEHSVIMIVFRAPFGAKCVCVSLCAC